MATESQGVVGTESRTERAAVTLTKSEKDALRLVALIEGTEESTLLRDRTIAEIVARASVLREKMEAA